MADAYIKANMRLNHVGRMGVAACRLGFRMVVVVEEGTGGAPILLFFPSVVLCVTRCM